MSPLNVVPVTVTTVILPEPPTLSITIVASFAGDVPPSAVPATVIFSVGR